MLTEEPTRSLPFNIKELCPEIKLAERCRSCNFTISLTQPHHRATGLCPGCGVKVCFTCGCTEEIPCVQECKGGYLPCSWYAPGACDFCFWLIALHAYRNTVARQHAEALADIATEFPELMNCQIEEA